MATEVPGYNWAEDEMLRDRMSMFRRLIAAMQDGNIEPCAAGAKYIDTFRDQLFSVIPFDEDGVPMIDLGAAEQVLLHDALAFAGASAKRSTKIVDYLENINALFSDPKWRKKVDAETGILGAELMRIAECMKKTMAAHDPENLPYADILTYRQYLDVMEHAEGHYLELMDSRSKGNVYSSAHGSSSMHAFNHAGAQMVLSMYAQRYARSAVTVVEDAVQTLLAIALMPEKGMNAHFVRARELQKMAGFLMDAAGRALDEGQRLARDSYRTREFERPVFRSDSSVNRQDPGSGPR